ncbi:hypothetical protein AMS68_002582 [Peltaster fructicola]|uniref:Partial AB-hydrolase lipase domain-containing protein n=1 Tax=Peltaster fructicola TaxID=286661 RepID=A0A6H0XQZ8_9PEZI|nr:hypothetical protein AMS68_002582 [Peltaster fructicola]
MARSDNVNGVVHPDHKVHDYQIKAKEYAKQARRLAHLKSDQVASDKETNTALEAKFITPHDPVVVTADGGRLPVVPIEEAVKLNQLKAEVEGNTPQSPPYSAIRESLDGSLHGTQRSSNGHLEHNAAGEGNLGDAMPVSRTNPLFPPLPIYGPPSLMRTIQCWFFRATSFVLSLGFLLVISCNAAATAIPIIIRRTRMRLLLEDPDADRPFHAEEKKRASERLASEKAWQRRQRSGEKKPLIAEDGYTPLEGGPDPIICDARYYARRVGLEMEIFEVQTEDGFIIELWHVFDPKERARTLHRDARGPEVFRTDSKDSIHGEAQEAFPETQKRYPVLMIHGLLQSSGAFCCNDDDSLAFFLAKSGYDVWLGCNRAGMTPKHTILEYGDPRMWAWNIRAMGVLDLPALISRVLAETGFPKLALIAHSQGTTQTFVALAKEQRPEIGEKISVFCALAPAVYAGPLIDRIYFKVMQAISPAVFRLIFGIHAFIPFMMECHKVLPRKFYSVMGYNVFSSLFNWSDERWDRGLRDRMFQFAPVYVSAESMRWWLGRECFAKQRCILATREAGELENKEDEEDDETIRKLYIDREPHITPRRRLSRNLTSFHCQQLTHLHHDTTRGKYAWYDKQFPPLALWVAGNDDLVDGRRLLRRFDRGREPHVRIVHKKIIEGYEHLDVIWAMDAIEKVGKEIREVIWRTADDDSQARCRVPTGCHIPLESDFEEVHSKSQSLQPPSHSGGRLRMASISEGNSTEDAPSTQERTQIDATRGPWTDIANADREEFKRAKVAGLASGRRPSEGYIGLEEKSNPFG